MRGVNGGAPAPKTETADHPGITPAVTIPNLLRCRSNPQCWRRRESLRRASPTGFSRTGHGEGRSDGPAGESHHGQRWTVGVDRKLGQRLQHRSEHDPAVDSGREAPSAPRGPRPPREPGRLRALGLHLQRRRRQHPVTRGTGRSRRNPRPPLEEGLTGLGLNRVFLTQMERRGLRTLRTTAGKVGRDRYVLKWITELPYVYLREYQGAASHARPKLRDLYLGRIAIELARDGSPEQLSAAAYRLRRKRDARQAGG
jgi:hypothetical protein